MVLNGCLVNLCFLLDASVPTQEPVSHDRQVKTSAEISALPLDKYYMEFVTFVFSSVGGGNM